MKHTIDSVLADINSLIEEDLERRSVANVEAAREIEDMWNDTVPQYPGRDTPRHLIDPALMWFRPWQIPDDRGKWIIDADGTASHEYSANMGSLKPSDEGMECADLRGIGIYYTGGAECRHDLASDSEYRAHFNLWRAHISSSKNMIHHSEHIGLTGTDLPWDPDIVF